MSGLGGVVMKRGKRRMSDFADIKHLADAKQGMQLTDRQAQLITVRPTVTLQ